MGQLNPIILVASSSFQSLGKASEHAKGYVFDKFATHDYNKTEDNETIVSTKYI